MTEPAPTVDDLDQAIIDAGRELADAEDPEEPRDPQRIADLRQALIDARTARGWPYA